MAKKPKPATRPRTGHGKVAERAFGPAADAFGTELAPVGQKVGVIAVRVSELLLRGIEPAVYGLERASDWIKQAVAERLQNVPKEKIVPPDPRIALPALQALVLSMDEEEVRKLFASLLAAAMNSDRRALAHPSFVELIKQMTGDEARVFKLLVRINGSFRMTFDSPDVPMGPRDDTPRGMIAYVMPFLMNIPEFEIYEDNAFVAASNLKRLGLLDIVRDIKKARNGFGSSGSVELLTTPLGERFAKVCLPEVVRLRIPKDLHSTRRPRPPSRHAKV
jgi:hypothetical protein